MCNTIHRIKRRKRNDDVHDSHARTASPKPSFTAPWRVGDAVVGKGNAGWKSKRLDILAHARTAYKGLLQRRLEEDLC